MTAPAFDPRSRRARLPRPPLTTPHNPRSKKQSAKRNDVSDSYAKALVELAEEKGKLEQVHADVDAVASLIKDNKKLTELLYNPVVDAAKKSAVLNKIAKEAGFQKYTGNFLNLLVTKDRLGLLNEICESFEEQYCELTDTQVRVFLARAWLQGYIGSGSSVEFGLKAVGS